MCLKISKKRPERGKLCILQHKYDLKIADNYAFVFQALGKG